MPREATLGFRALQHVVSTPNFAARACAAQMSTDLQYCMIRPEMRRTVAVQLKESDEGGSTEPHGFHFGRFAIAPCLSKDDLVPKQGPTWLAALVANMHSSQGEFEWTKLKNGLREIDGMAVLARSETA